MTAMQTFRNTLIVLATLAMAYILFSSARILVVLMVAIIIASAVRPVVRRLVAWRIPAGLAILFVYILVALTIVALTVLVVPPILSELAGYLDSDWQLAARIILAKGWIEQTLSGVSGGEVHFADPEEVRTAVSEAVDRIQKTIPTLLDDASATLGDLILILVMGVYWLTSYDKVVDFVTELVPRNRRDQTQDIIHEIETLMGSYTRGVVLVAGFVGIANFAILSVLRIPDAATFAFIVGVSTMLPVIGGFIGGGLSTFLAALSSPIHAAAVFGTFVVVQQLENYLLTPRAMSRSVRLDPLFVLVAVFTGFGLAGVIGAILAVPVSGAVGVLLRYLVFEPRKAEVNAYSVVDDGAVLIQTGEPSSASHTAK